VDNSVARNWLEKAAIQGYESAVYLLYQIESLRWEVEESWYHRLPGLHRLAAHGDIEAQHQLAERIEHGADGFHQDLTTAIEWYRRAASGGHAQAAKKLGEILARQKNAK
jgi:TPR repeat protein